MIEADNRTVQVTDGLDDFHLVVVGHYFEALMHIGATLAPSKRAPNPAESGSGAIGRRCRQCTGTSLQARAIFSAFSGRHLFFRSSCQL